MLLSIILLTETGEGKYLREIVEFEGGQSPQNSSRNINEGPGKIEFQKLRQTVAWRTGS